MTDLVVIDTKTMQARRVHDNTITEQKVQFAGDATGQELRDGIEWVRQNGLPKGGEAVTLEPGAIAFREINRHLARAGLRDKTDEYLKQQWDAIGDDSFSPDRHDCADIHLELNRRGLGEYCAV